MSQVTYEDFNLILLKGSTGIFSVNDLLDRTDIFILDVPQILSYFRLF